MADEGSRKRLLKAADIDALGEARIGHPLKRIGRPNEPDASAIRGVCGATKPSEYPFA